ncbi:protein AF1q [Scyliorhinus torazame]|uniref:Putative WW-binding domain-containing protein n=1 Tax=Scyliorhinus torazame TaxID=75743 RepID=A0A401PAD4_SCYTO|nr:hypothetical protein [Scyliorhinus torazame]
MSKRKGEDILCCRPSKRFVSLFVDLKGVRPAPRRDSSAKRKLQAEGEAELLLEPACKRLENARRGRAEPGDRSASHGEGWVRPRAPGLGAGEPGASRSPTGSSLTGTVQNAPEDEVSCQYNSFQFWRVPLPVVELAEIEDFGQLKTAEEMNCEDPEETTEIEMELQN